MLPFVKLKVLNLTAVNLKVHQYIRDFSNADMITELLAGELLQSAFQ